MGEVPSPGRGGRWCWAGWGQVAAESLLPPPQASLEKPSPALTSWQGWSHGGCAGGTSVGLGGWRWEQR